MRLTVEDLSVDVGLRRRSLTLRNGKVGREGGGSKEQGGKEGGAHWRARDKRVWGGLKTTKEVYEDKKQEREISVAHRKSSDEQQTLI